jgi:hypothetical protein
VRRPPAAAALKGQRQFEQLWTPTGAGISKNRQSQPSRSGPNQLDTSPAADPGNSTSENARRGSSENARTELPRCPSHSREIQLVAQNSAPSERRRCPHFGKDASRTRETDLDSHRMSIRAGTNRNNAHFLKPPPIIVSHGWNHTPFWGRRMQSRNAQFRKRGIFLHPVTATLTHISGSASGSGYAYFRKIGGPSARFRKTRPWDSRPPQTMHTTYGWRGSIYG